MEALPAPDQHRMQPQQPAAPGQAAPPPGQGRQVDGSIHPEVQRFSQEMFALKKKIEEYQAMNAKKNAPGASDAVKSSMNLRLRAEVKNADEMFRGAYAKVAMFEDDLKKYGLKPQNIQLFKQNLATLDRIRKAVFAEACGRGQDTLRGAAVKISRTEETERQRNMTTAQVVDDTDKILNKQNEVIDAIGHAVRETKAASLEMNDQLTKSNTHLADISTEMDYTNQNIIARTNQINKVSRMTRKHKTWLMGAINAVLAIGLGLIIYYGVESLKADDEAADAGQE